jgi:hypothetical protein
MIASCIKEIARCLRHPSPGSALAPLAQSATAQLQLLTEIFSNYVSPAPLPPVPLDPAAPLRVPVLAAQPIPASPLRVPAIPALHPTPPIANPTPPIIAAPAVALPSCNDGHMIDERLEDAGFGYHGFQMPGYPNPNFPPLPYPEFVSTDRACLACHGCPFLPHHYCYQHFQRHAHSSYPPRPRR